MFSFRNFMNVSQTYSIHFFEMMNILCLIRVRELYSHTLYQKQTWRIFNHLLWRMLAITFYNCCHHAMIGLYTAMYTKLWTALPGIWWLCWSYDKQLREHCLCWSCLQASWPQVAWWETKVERLLRTLVCFRYWFSFRFRCSQSALRVGSVFSLLHPHCLGIGAVLQGPWWCFRGTLICWVHLLSGRMWGGHVGLAGP